MHYIVKMALNAVEQVSEIVAYISKVLLVPDTAAKWADYLHKEVTGLNEMPLRFSLVEDEPWRSKGIRKMSVKNFLVYYLINEETTTVWVTAVTYGKRNQITALRNMPM